MRIILDIHETIQHIENFRLELVPHWITSISVVTVMYMKEINPEFIALHYFVDIL